MLTNFDRPPNLDKNLDIIAGIYMIINLINWKFYIGSSTDLDKRWWRSHILKLLRGKHDNIILQRAVEKYGLENFQFIAIELLPKDKKICLAREQEYLDQYNPPYNIGLEACGGDNFTNHPNKELVKQNARKGWNSWYENISDEEFSKLYDSRRGEGNSFWGRKHTEESKRKIANRVYDGKSPDKRKVIIDGVIYDSAHAASKKLGIGQETVRERIKSEYFNYQYYEDYTNGIIKDIKSINNYDNFGKNTKWPKSSRGINPTPRKIIINNVIYNSATEASKKLGIKGNTLSYRANSMNFPDYMYYDDFVNLGPNFKTKIERLH